MYRRGIASGIWVRSMVPLMLTLLMACQQQSTAEVATTAAIKSATMTPSATTVAATPTLAPGQFANPVITTNFPDPGIINVDGTYYAYATNGNGKNIQTTKSTDLVHWTMLADAMPMLPKWSNFEGGFMWAPEVIKINDTYVMYYTGRDREFDVQCVGVATSDRPDGRFTDSRDKPLVCQNTEGGTIDASPFQDDDKLYLYFKNDGNCCGQPTHISVQELALDGLSLVGSPTQLLVNDQGWEGNVIEAPTMWKEGGMYYLFFSANSYAGAAYSVGYATCDSPTGPCQDAPENPILKSAFDRVPSVIGPGHQTIVADKDGGTWLVYHHWEVLPGGLRGERRFVSLDRLRWENGKPIVDGPTSVPQALP